MDRETKNPRPRGKIHPKLTDDAPPPRARPALIAAPAVPAEPAATVKDWKADPDLRAFACAVSFEAGWMTEPAEIVWSYDEPTKVLEVRRPETSAGALVGASRAVFNGARAAGTMLMIRDRYGFAVEKKVQAYVSPAPPELARSPLGLRALYLRDLAARTYTAGGTRELIEIALVDLARYCVDIVRGANLGDPSPSAHTTRQLAAGGILELINPAPR